VSDRRIEQLFNAHAKDVLAYAKRRTDAHTAEDVTAEVFVVAWRKSDGLPEHEPVLWLFAVARKLLANERRAAGRRAALTTALASLRRTDQGPDPADAQAPVMDAMQTLRRADREVLMLSAWEGLDARQIGVVVGCSQQAAHARLSRARKRLREQLATQTDAYARPATPSEVPAP
jgi:RNA polymerase sigma-70 factor (ECF subfamily)